MEDFLTEKEKKCIKQKSCITSIHFCRRPHFVFLCSQERLQNYNKQTKNRSKKVAEKAQKEHACFHTLYMHACMHMNIINQLMRPIMKYAESLGSLFIPQTELIDRTIFQDFIISPGPINKQTEDTNKLAVSENEQMVSDNKQTVSEKKQTTQGCKHGLN